MGFATFQCCRRAGSEFTPLDSPLLSREVAMSKGYQLGNAKSTAAGQCQGRI